MCWGLPGFNNNKGDSIRYFFQRYLMPGLIFQSVIISGGYATGRELIEFFMFAGPVSGILGMFLAMMIWSAVLALTFEFARAHMAYDYRTFFRALLGRAWFLFELSYLALAMIALAVIGAAAGLIFQDITGAPEIVGTLIMIAAIGVLAFYGSALIEKIMSFWSLVLYAAYVSLFVIAYQALGSDVSTVVSQSSDFVPNWLSSMEYAGSNLAAAPAVLFCIRHIQLRREAIWAGVLAGPLAMIPAVLFYIILLSQYPEVLDQEIPLISLLNRLNVSPFALIFKIVIFGTFIESGIALVHSVNERIANMRRSSGKEMSHKQRVLVAVVLLVTSIYLATTMGLIDLIGKGYATLSYFIMAFYLVPLLTLGIFKIRSISKTDVIGETV